MNRAIPPSLFNKQSEAIIFFICGIAWILFLSSVGRFKQMNWFYYLVFCRIFLSILAFAGGTVVYFSTKRNLLSYYFVICAVLQSTLSILEGKEQIQFYEYIAYFVLLSALTFHGTFKKWFKNYYSILFLATIVPLFFKKTEYFSSISSFVFNLTTTVAIAFFSIVIIKVTTSRYKTLIENIDLKNKLIEVHISQKQIVEKELNKAKEQLVESSKFQATAELARQVAHDIRSPLSALNMATMNLGEIPEANQLLLKKAIQRINDIASDLLSKGKKEKTSNEQFILTNNSFSEENSHTIAELIDYIIVEKKIQFSNLKNVEIEKIIDKDSSKISTQLKKMDLLRILSNLINNSVESIGANKGKIILSLKSENEFVQLKIEDNGCGIPPNILKKLGSEIFSYGKENLESGTGLGIYHAKKLIEVNNGYFKITSELNIGTIVEIKLPKYNVI